MDLSTLCPQLVLKELLPDGTVRIEGVGGSCPRTLAAAVEVMIRHTHRVSPKLIGRVWIELDDRVR